MAKIIPYMTFENSLEAIEYYQKIFGEKILVDRKELDKNSANFFKTEPDPKKTIHGVLVIAENLIMFSDNFSENKISPMTILINFNGDNENEFKEAEKIMNNAKNNQCKITMQFEKQAWGGAMGAFIDKYKNIWMIHAESFQKNSKENEVFKKYYKI
ncbi:MAG: hypothetical protein HPPSJP_5030 [Candidatus Hepatoplasma scabrum]|nr:MAG: hypothetical protein HPPSJP_5030 [Candidatus Hepatoplasma sp.]